MVSCSSQVISSDEARYFGLLDGVGQQSYFYLCRAARSLGRVYCLKGCWVGPAQSSYLVVYTLLGHVGNCPVVNGMKWNLQNRRFLALAWCFLIFVICV